MPYTVDPRDPASPLDSQDAEQGAEELRKLKGLVVGTVGVFSPHFYSSGAAFTHNVTDGKYKVVGDMCFFSLAVRCTDRTGVLSNDLHIDVTGSGGLPAMLPGSLSCVCSVGQTKGLGGAIVAQGIIAGLIGLYVAGTDTTLLAVSMDVGGATLYLNGFYEVDHP